MTPIGEAPAVVDALASPMAASLARAGARITGPRLAVAGMVAARDGHFTAAELLADARRDPGGIGRATVFRCLDLFTSLGLIERVDLPDGTHAWVACEDVHHHHAICTTCGRSIDVADQGLTDALALVARQTGFRVASHRLEVFGTCASCLAAGA